MSIQCVNQCQDCQGLATALPAVPKATAASVWRRGSRVSRPGARLGFSKPSLPGTSPGSPRFAQIFLEAVEPGTGCDPQPVGARDGQAGGFHAGQTRPYGALLPHLMGLNDVELAEIDPALDDESACAQRGLKQRAASIGSDNDAVEPLILSRRTTARPCIGGHDVGRLANCIGTDFASWLDHPLRLVLPQFLVADFVGAAVLGLDSGRTGVPVTPVSKQPELVLVNSKLGEQIFRLGKIGSPSTDQRKAVAKQSTNPNVVTCQVVDCGDVARLRDEGKGF